MVPLFGHSSKASATIKTVSSFFATANSTGWREYNAATCVPLLHVSYSFVSSSGSSARWLHSWAIKVDTKFVAFCFSGLLKSK